jgi:uncharacterized phosphosugar-binding protein
LWKSSSGEDPIGDETAQAERAKMAEMIALTDQRIA